MKEKLKFFAANGKERTVADCQPKRTPVPYSADSVSLIIRTDTNDYSTVFLT